MLSDLEVLIPKDTFKSNKNKWYYQITSCNLNRSELSNNINYSALVDTSINCSRSHCVHTSSLGWFIWENRKKAVPF